MTTTPARTRAGSTAEKPGPVAAALKMPSDAVAGAVVAFVITAARMKTHPHLYRRSMRRQVHAVSVLLAAHAALRGGAGVDADSAVSPIVDKLAGRITIHGVLAAQAVLLEAVVAAVLAMRDDLDAGLTKALAAVAAAYPHPRLLTMTAARDRP